MKTASPSLEEWRELYDAALQFKELKPWEWMLDSDIFGVQNPFTGEVGYCCIMGNLGEVFALAVYLGTDGLEGYLKIQSQEVTAEKDIMEAFTAQKCLMASFEEREVLQKPDLEVIKKLGLKFRGKKEWPSFRSYRPGYFPWYLTRDEAKFLTLALQQTVMFARRFQENSDMLVPQNPNQYLVRVPEKTKEGWIWRDEWQEPSPLDEEEIAETLDEDRVQRAQKKVGRKGGTWEVDLFYVSAAVKEKTDERPYYPLIFMFVDHHSGLILNPDFMQSAPSRSDIQKRFLNFIENIGFMPNEILVKREKVFDPLEPIASKLGIRLKQVTKLKMLDEARSAMESFLG